MKHFISVLVFTFVTAFVCFAVMRWGFHTDINEAVGTGLGAALGGLVVEVFSRHKDKRSGKNTH